MKRINHAFGALLAIAIAGCSGYQGVNAPKEITSLSSLDCTVDKSQCHYIAVFEVAAYFDACPVAISKKFNAPGPNAAEVAVMDRWLTDWKDLNTPELKTAVLDKTNPLRQYLKTKTIDYLASVPADDVGIECSRLGMVKDGQPAESMSDLLRHTKDFAKVEQTR